MVEKGTFMWAVKQMKNGKKVRRAYFDTPRFIELRGDILYDSKYSQFDVDLDCVEATDWQIYEDTPTLARVQEGRQKLHEKGYTATDVIFKYPEDNVLIIGEQEIACVRGKWDTGATIFGMKIWVDETIEDNCFYIVDKNNAQADADDSSCSDIDWNLADQSFDREDPEKIVKDVKTFIEKVKEDISKFINRNKYNDAMLENFSHAIKIIDKRAGDL
jgi:hypothetical protein